MKRNLFSILLFAVVISGCGGGGGGGSAPVSASTNFTAVAMAGELLTYSLNTTSLTYSYTITESQFGLTGKSGSGTLVRNSDGSYSPAGIGNVKLVILPNGLLLGGIRENLNGTPTTIPIIGMSNPVADISAAAGTYNAVQRSCLAGVCSSAFGTFQISAAGTWISCPSGNLTTGCLGSMNSGTLNSLGGGRWQVMSGGADIGTAIGLNSGGQNVVILDLKDTRAGGFGVGLLVGSSQQSVSATQTNGTWVAAATTGDWATFSASGNQITFLTIDGLPSNATTMLTIDSPWTGFATTASGGHGLLAGTGVYAYENTAGYAEIGVKIN